MKLRNEEMERIHESLHQILLPIFESSQGKSPQSLVDEIQSVLPHDEMRTALIDAVHGDNRLLNTLLFEMTAQPEVVWIAPVAGKIPEYVWMIGHRNLSAKAVQSSFINKRVAIATDQALKQYQFPPPLLFVDPVAVSKTKNTDQEDEFAIFQTGYSETPDGISDLNQRMVINVRHATTKRELAFERMDMLSTIDDSVLKCLRENAELFSIIHSDAHNSGHFVGNWPYEDVIKKNCIPFEAVEEFKACLASILLAEHILEDNVLKDAFAVSVFAARFFGYGYEAFYGHTHRRETVREITVGLLFFEWLVLDKAIEIITEDNKYRLLINSSKVRCSLRNAYDKINQQEYSCTRTSSNLKSIAYDWYNLAFPLGDYSSNARLVYTDPNLKGGD